jgi:hypothetical protein
MKSSTEIMVKYYDAISSADLQTICECFDVPSKLISLYGVVNITNKEEKIERSEVRKTVSRGVV